MKIYKVEKTENITRISFNAHISVTFEEATIEEVYDLFLKVFKDLKTRDYIIEHDVFNKPIPKSKTLVQVRAEGAIEGKGSGYKGVSKSKTLYGIDEDEAREYFLNNYKKYI